MVSRRALMALMVSRRALALAILTLGVLFLCNDTVVSGWGDMEKPGL